MQFRSVFRSHCFCFFEEFFQFRFVLYKQCHSTLINYRKSHIAVIFNPLNIFYFAVTYQNSCTVLNRQNIKVFRIFEAVTGNRHFITYMIGFLIRSGFGHHCIFQIEIKFFKHITADFDIVFLKIWFISVIFYGFQYTTSRSHMADTVNQDHFTKCLMLLKFIQHDFLSQFDLTECDFIFFNIISRNMFSCIDINLIFDASDESRNSLCTEFYQILFSEVQSAVIHPEKCCCKALYNGKLCLICQNASTADIYFFVKLDRHCLAYHRLIYGCTSVQK